MPSIRRVVLFGSLAAGIPTPSSDADLLVILESSSFEAPRDRVVGRCAFEDSPVARTALAQGLELL